MLTYNELMELRDKLESGEIQLEIAKEQLWSDFKEGQRSWHTQDWKERRLKFIKEKCEICNSTDTLTLQHRSHPRKLSEYIKEITRGYTNDHINEYPVTDKSNLSNYILKMYDYDPVPLCPNCKSKNPNTRVRKTPKYRCEDCKFEFDEAVYRSVDELLNIFYENEEAYEVRDKCFVSNQWKNNHNLSSVRYWLQRESAKNKNSEAIEKEAYLLYLNDNVKYLSFEDTITACRKCASSYDLHRMEICPECKIHYKGIQYPTCIQCLPEDKRKEVLETLKFYKEMREIHRELGID